jgi:hypothetical protein
MRKPSCFNEYFKLEFESEKRKKDKEKLHTKVTHGGVG